MHTKSFELLALTILAGLLAGCQPSPLPPTAAPATPVSSSASPVTTEPAGERTLLTAADLLEGFKADSPLAEAALAMPPGAAPPQHTFEGRLELKGEASHGQAQALRGSLPGRDTHLPEFDFELVQLDSYLIPRSRGLVIADHPYWNLILEPGRVWQEPGDLGFSSPEGYSRASLPFTLVPKGENSTFNGVLTFLFDDASVSRVWYQITQETSYYRRANAWGLLEAAYHPGPVEGAEQIREAYKAELAGRLPTRPIEQLAVDYPGLDPTAIGRGVTPEHMSWYGFVIDGVNYTSGCRTRFGDYPYCAEMRAPSFSIAKSTFASLALMRLAQKYGPQIAGLRILDYVPEAAGSPGDWQAVTFDHVLDMATGNYASPSFMADEDGSRMTAFFVAQFYDQRIAAAFEWPHSAPPGTQWVYHTSDTFIVTRAMHNYLQSMEGAQADLFDFVVDEVYRPLGIGPGAYSTLRTADDNWQGQAEGGYGLWWIADDIAKLALFFNVENGQIAGEQILHLGLMAAALQRDPDDRGVAIGTNRMYNNAFWAQRYGPADGFDCEFWVTTMQGVSGNVVALFPNGTAYYYFSDNGEFTWDAALRQADAIRPFCP
jgi:hypothetical protein